MDKPISISGYKKYMTCPKMYEYHYVDKDRPAQKTSALLFGSIMDDVINALLLGETTDPDTMFITKINNIIDACEPMFFYTDDFDADFCSVEIYAKEARLKGWKGDDMTKAIKSFIKDQDNLSKNQYSILHRACWETLEKKGLAMIDGFIKWVLPNIKEVHDVQKHLVTKKGDIHGYLDFTCTWKDGRKILFDLKTAKTAYEKDAVLTNPQLALYCGIEKYEYAGFIVMSKQIKKNKVKTCKACPDVRIEGGNAKKCPKCGKIMDFTVKPTSYVQVLIDKMPQKNIDLTAKAIRGTIKSIDEGKFQRNLNNCKFIFGRPCPYINKCWEK